MYQWSTDTTSSFLELNLELSQGICSITKTILSIFCLSQMKAPNRGGCRLLVFVDKLCFETKYFYAMVQNINQLAGLRPWNHVQVWTCMSWRPQTRQRKSNRDERSLSASAKCKLTFRSNCSRFMEMFCLDKCSVIAACRLVMMDWTELKAAILTLLTLYDLVRTSTSIDSM